MIISPKDKELIKEAKQLANRNQIKFMLHDPDGLTFKLCNMVILLVDVLERESGISFD